MIKVKFFPKVLGLSENSRKGQSGFFDIRQLMLNRGGKGKEKDYFSESILLKMSVSTRRRGKKMFL